MLFSSLVVNKNPEFELSWVLLLKSRATFDRVNTCAGGSFRSHVFKFIKILAECIFIDFFLFFSASILVNFSNQDKNHGQSFFFHLVIFHYVWLALLRLIQSMKFNNCFVQLR